MNRRRDRGFMLATVLVVMSLVGGMISLLVINSRYFLRERQAQRARIVAGQLAESAADYAHMHASDVAKMDAKPLELDVKSILSAGMHGSAVITHVDGSRFHIHAEAAAGRTSSQRDVEITLSPSSAPSP